MKTAGPIPYTCGRRRAAFLNRAREDALTPGRMAAVHSRLARYGMEKP